MKRILDALTRDLEAVFGEPWLCAVLAVLLAVSLLGLAQIIGWLVFNPFQ
jgi:hypothetical protein